MCCASSSADINVIFSVVICLIIFYRLFVLPFDGEIKIHESIIVQSHCDLKMLHGDVVMQWAGRCVHVGPGSTSGRGECLAARCLRQPVFFLQKRAI